MSYFDYFRAMARGQDVWSYRASQIPSPIITSPEPKQLEASAVPQTRGIYQPIGTGALGLTVERVVSSAGESNLSESQGKINLKLATRDGFNKAILVRNCVDLISGDVASVPLVVMRRRKDGKLRPVNTLQAQRLQRLIDQPNHQEPRQRFVERMMQHLLLSGNALFYKSVRASGKPVPLELDIIDPDEMTPRVGYVNRRKVLASYDRRGYVDGHYIRERLEPDDVGHIMLSNPVNAFWGSSVLNSAALTVDSDTEGLGYQKTMQGRKGRPSAAVSFKEELDEQAYNDRRNRLDDTTAADQEGKILILDDGATIQALSITPRELQFLESRVHHRNDLLALYHIPPPVAGYYEDANYANVSGAYRIYWEQTIPAHLTRLCEALTSDLAYEFGDDLVIVADITRVPAMTTVLESRLKSAKLMSELGVRIEAINERLDLGLAPEDFKPQEKKS